MCIYCVYIHMGRALMGRALMGQALMGWALMGTLGPFMALIG